MSKIIISSPFFHNENGHHYHYFQAVFAAAKSIGLQMEAYVPQNCSIDFAGSGYRKYFRWHSKRKKRERMQQKDYFWLIKKEARQNNWFFFETFAFRHFLAITLGLLLFAKRPTKTIVFVRETNLSSKKERVFNYCCRLLGKKFGGNLILGTDSDLIAAYFADKYGLAFQVFPIPLSFSVVLPFRKRATVKNLWLPGHIAKGKGLCRLLPMLQKGLVTA